MSTINVRQDILQRSLALCGVAAPILFIATFTVLGMFRDDYSPIKHFVSELGATGVQNAAAQNANFVVTGLLIMSFAVGLFRAIGSNKRAKIAAGLVVSTGAGLAGSGIFPGDRLPVPPEPSVSALLHYTFAGLAFLAIVSAILVFSRSLPRSEPWLTFRRYSLITGVVASGLLVLTWLSVPSASGIPSLQQWAGLFQRLFAVTWLLWVAVMAIRLFRLPDAIDGPSADAAGRSERQ
ncbi:MAG: hypothetical protein CL878_11860 [Dehalococcoidia bacterium]|nr:hypothetical protein [Dehalococcoidia bacterium]